MALPEVETTTATKTDITINEDFQSRNFNDLDNLLSELATPKQEFNTSPTKAPGADPIEETELNPIPFTKEDAQRAGERMATLTDSILGVSGMLIAKEDDPKRYKASDGELKDMANAWSEVSEQYSFKINPWMNILVLIVMIYMPKIILATNDRRIKVIEEKQKKLEARIAEMESKEKEPNEKGN